MSSSPSTGRNDRRVAGLLDGRLTSVSSLVTVLVDSGRVFDLSTRLIYQQQISVIQNHTNNPSLSFGLVSGRDRRHLRDYQIRRLYLVLFFIVSSLIVLCVVVLRTFIDTLKERPRISVHPISRPTNSHLPQFLVFITEQCFSEK